MAYWLSVCRAVVALDNVAHFQIRDVEEIDYVVLTCVFIDLIELIQIWIPDFFYTRNLGAVVG